MRGTVLLVCIAVFVVASAILAETNFTDQVSRMWFQGQKAGVYSIATNRLAADTNDLAGLILKMEYEIAYLSLDDATSTMQRVLQVGSTVSSTNFAETFPGFEADINNIKAMILQYPAGELTADQGKGDIAGKPLPHEEVIRALEDDGHID